MSSGKSWMPNGKILFFVPFGTKQAKYVLHNGENHKRMHDNATRKVI